MNTVLAILTYFAYLFIVYMYTMKSVKYIRLPIHLRWELYPVIHEPRYRYGGSRMEELDGHSRARQGGLIRSILYLLKEYVSLSEYYKKQKVYWSVIYPWHIGFILIITFHILAFFGALLLLAGVPVGAGSPALGGKIFYFLMLFCGIVSFVAGLIGSIGVLIKRVVDTNLRDYAAPQQYFTYLFCLAIFGSGLYSWWFVDPSFSEYRQFWVGLVTLHPVAVAPASALHITLFDFFLIYLPFTRSMHYVTRVFAFFLIRWDDRPNRRGGEIERQLLTQFGRKVSWSAPHIEKGGTWAEQVAHRSEGDK
jgi:nitrate reductase gamma subunit